MTLRIRSVTISPKQAEAMMIKTKEHYAKLGRPHNYKPLNAARVLEIVDDLVADRFDENGETIKETDGGLVIDGQHRLEACILSQIPLKTVLVTGVTEDMVMDVGRPRSLGNSLRNSGIKYYNYAATLTRFVEATDLRTGEFHMASCRKFKSPAKLLATFRKHEKAINHSIDTVAEWVGGSNKAIVSISILAYAHMMATRVDAEMGLDFAHKLATSLGVGESSSIYRWRGRMMTNAKATAKLHHVEIIALLMKAWELFIDGSPCSALVFRANEGNPSWHIGGPAAVDAAAEEHDQKFKRKPAAKKVAAKAKP